MTTEDELKAALRLLIDYADAAVHNTTNPQMVRVIMQAGALVKLWVKVNVAKPPQA